MTQPEWLPQHLQARAFSVQTAQTQGIGRHRQDSQELQRPFTGVRSLQGATSVLDQALQYLPRLRHRQVFGGITAVRLLGLPWISPRREHETLELAVPGDAYKPRSRGVKTMRLAEHRFTTVMASELPTLSPIAAVMSVADRLSQHQLVGLMEALICRSERYPKLLWRPMCTSVDELRESVELWGPGPARSRARAALPAVRLGPESFPESITRLVLIDAGLPEPELHPEVATRLGTLHPDGGWGGYRVCYEYEGDHHRTDKAQWDADIGRHDALAAVGWRVVRVTARDLRQPQQLAQRIMAALTAAGWIPGR